MRVLQSSTALPIVVILIVFGLPLFLGLGASDVGNDEAIYSYAVERILETGDWLLPRSIPDDFPFLEKPPLKFWMVAAPIVAGVLPHDETGMRAIDALFGAVAFVYVFLLGRSLGGLVCGGTAVLVLFSLPSLVFEHGLRSNNMEASLLLAYCGGIYHFARWLQNGDDRDGPSRSHGVKHAAAVTAYFVLGFMTKFVAAFFLPMICGMALLVTPGGWRRLWQGRRDWRWPAVAAVAISAPWFVYHTQQFGAHFWRVIFGAHVLERMTGALDPQHLNPWNAYFLWTWRDRGTRTACGRRVGRAAGAGQDDLPLVGASVRAHLDGHLENLSLRVSVSSTARARAGVVRLGCRRVDRWTPVGGSADIAVGVSVDVDV
jgi:4-amino-4-deoxy-L-arabinose transferase-like glycosyltransferase